VVDRTIGGHLEVLGRARGWRVRIGLVKRVDHAHAFDGSLRNAVDCDWGRDARCFKDCWHDVDDMVKLRTDGTHIFNMTGP
jgi:hypothetical protein